MKPFLRAVLFCDDVETVEDRPRFTVIEEMHIDVQKGEDDESPLPVPVYVAIQMEGATGPQDLTAHFVDGTGQAVGLVAFARITPDFDQWADILQAPLPVRTGDFRLLVSLNGALIGWAPFHLVVSKSLRGDS